MGFSFLDRLRGVILAVNKTKAMTIEIGNVLEILVAIGIAYAIILSGKYVVLRVFLRWLLSDEDAQEIGKKYRKKFAERIEELKAEKEAKK